MEKVNQYLFYEFGGALRGLRSLKEGDKHREYAFTCAIARGALAKFEKEFSHVPLNRSRIAARKLNAAIEKYSIEFTLEGLGQLGKGDNLTKYDANNIHRELDYFEAVFSNEAQDLEIFSIPQKLAYSTTTLIERGEEVLPGNIRLLVSEFTKNEIREGTRCLVCDLPTAAGFHFLRALESSLRHYYDSLSGGQPRPKLNNENDAPMGDYINAIERLQADRETVETLRQVKRLHRDPHMHPESVFDLSEAVILLGVVTSAIWSMFRNVVPEIEFSTDSSAKKTVEAEEANHATGV